MKTINAHMVRILVYGDGQGRCVMAFDQIYHSEPDARIGAKRIRRNYERDGITLPQLYIVTVYEALKGSFSSTIRCLA